MQRSNDSRFARLPLAALTIAFTLASSSGTAAEGHLIIVSAGAAVMSREMIPRMPKTPAIKAQNRANGRRPFSLEGRNQVTSKAGGR